MIKKKENKKYEKRTGARSDGCVRGYYEIHDLSSREKTRKTEGERDDDIDGVCARVCVCEGKTSHCRSCD